MSLYIDADTILISSTEQQDNKLCKATNTHYGTTRIFPSKTEFNKWVKETEGKKKEDYSFEVVRELIDPENAVRFACKSVRDKIENIVEATGTDDFYICIQGKGNFRKAYESKYIDYKSSRSGYTKPLTYAEVLDWMKKKWKQRLLIIDDIETDDFVVIKGYEGHVIAACDKDIRANLSGSLFNYYAPENGVINISDYERDKLFCYQMLFGDDGDCVNGIERISDDDKKNFKLRTTKVGDVAATKLLEDCLTSDSLFQRVYELYQRAWPDDYIERLVDNYFFLRMLREDELSLTNDARIEKAKEFWSEYATMQ